MPVSSSVCGVQGALDGLLADKTKLADVLKYHVVPLVVKVRHHPTTKPLIMDTSTRSNPIVG